MALCYILEGMFRHGLEGRYYLKTFLNCFLLSFLAGNVNAGGYLACGRFVTHVTGFATLFGIDVAQGQWQGALGILSVPFYFLLGSMLAAYLIERRLQQNLRPLYSVVMSLIFLCLLTVALGGYFDLFGIFGKSVHLQEDYLFLVLLCGASGLQNAAITSFSGAVVRTTHLTGITTDLGIGIVRLFSPITQEKHFQREKRANWLRIITILGFILGSVTGAFLFLKFHYLGFLLPAALAGYAIVAAFYAEKSIVAQQQNASIKPEESMALGNERRL